ncbi:putative pyruvate carboxylase [Aspergillus heteromorphus CBS 117.55]|uniref:Putative pyruvate carboxylase n=1 Tax=Aspergillus heteromorphus CBS 117.55 TaxID=1448321 RepID=A0A317VEY3_9EURO|nr:putative pyruvate carboxylase [Aspergillus heteromorphus CBS 117.55]PWY72926.1 putative pyruvate carboxylase [Aspergillus heteromorphus CBS 117.55]
MPSLTPLRRLLVANRGEIAVRIIQAARELSPPIEVFAIYTDDDRSHCEIGCPHQALRVPSVSAYLDIPVLVHLAQEHAIDAVHPGYGFLSESAEFATRMHDGGVTVIGPGWEALARTGDKLQAKQLAIECNVPVLPAMAHPTADLAKIRAFADQIHYPVVIKAVDGGGGRGIRLVQQEDQLESAVRGATSESPSQTVFVEKAAVSGFRHIEVQIIGDGTDVRHLWERDCSIQRRFQKVVEVAPSSINNRALVHQVADAALRMARVIHYRSLGTVEFLINEYQEEFYFLEINPRLQVEHTITEAITGVDLVQAQLQVAQGCSLAQLGLNESAPALSRVHSVQLRLCAEDPRNHFSLSIGKVTDFFVPGGNGVRVDTHISMANISPVVIGTQLDNLLAKIIVTASTWEATVLKAQRVLADVRIAGIQTNLELLRGIVSHEDFLAGNIDTQWLESQLDQIIQLGGNVKPSHILTPTQISQAPALPSMPASNLLFRRGDAWSISLAPFDAPRQQQEEQHHLQITRVLQNDFPASLTAEIEYKTRSSSTAHRLQLVAAPTAASALVTSSHRRGDVSNPRHIVLPLSGRLIEVLVSAGDVVAENQVVAFVKQMKMELEVRSPRAGRAQWVYEMEEEEEDVSEGMLLVELEGMRGKL